MKTRMIISVAIGLYGMGLVSPHAQDWNLEVIYQQWHKALDSNPVLCEPHFFDMRIPELRPALEGMMSNKMAMAYFICEKLATNEYAEAEVRGPGRLYRDLNLLCHLTGITFRSLRQARGGQLCGECG